jgi:hypothetical protein
MDNGTTFLNKKQKTIKLELDLTMMQRMKQI